jgi:protein ImuB
MLARGAASRPLVPVEEPLDFEETLELENPVALLEPLAFLLNRMLERLCARLAARALAMNELTLTCALDAIADCRLQNAESADRDSQDSAICNLHSSIHKRTLRLPVPTKDARTLLKLLQLDLEAHPPGAPVVKITLAAAPAKPRPPQGGLFAPLSPPPEKLELTLARLAGVVGEEQVGAAELEDTHRPDAFRMGKFGREIENDKFKMRNAKKLALRRFRPPRRAQVEVRGGRPAEVRFGPVRGRVVELAGPWRTSGEWWTGEGWARDEWDVALEEKSGGALYRIYRDLKSGAWFVEGSYD